MTPLGKQENAAEEWQRKWEAIGLGKRDRDREKTTDVIIHPCNLEIGVKKKQSKMIKVCKIKMGN